MTKRFNFLMLACTAALAFSCSTVQAQLAVDDIISIDFGLTDPDPVTSPNWNTLTSVVDQPLILRGDGSASGVTISTVGLQNVEDMFSTGPNSDSNDPTIAEDGIYSGGQAGRSLTFTFDGLNTNLLYSLDQGFAVVGTTQYDSIVSVPGFDPLTNTQGFSGANLAYESFDGISSSDGTFSFNIAATGAGTRAGIAQLTLTATGVNPNAVPEPSSLAVLGMGVIGLIARRRRAA